MATFSDAERTRSIQFIGKLMQACRGHDRELDNRLAKLKQKLDGNPPLSSLDADLAVIQGRSVAVIGASADATKMTGRPVGYLQKYGFTGEIWPVNPRVESIAGLRCYPDVASLPGAPDAVMTPQATEQ